MNMFFCKSTAVEKSMMAKNPKDAAEKFVNDILHNCYKFKLKKVSERGAKEAPDFTVTVNVVGENKPTYFQYSSLKPKR